MYITVAAVGLRRWFPLWSLIIKVTYIMTIAKLFTQNPAELVLSENSELRAQHSTGFGFFSFFILDPGPVASHINSKLTRTNTNRKGGI
jgi:hypothetical protein